MNQRPDPDLLQARSERDFTHVSRPTTKRKGVVTPIRDVGDTGYHSGEVTITRMPVDPRVWETAMEIARGDDTRIARLSYTEVVVRNR